MKIKYLIIAVLATCILSTPLIAKDKVKHKPVKIETGIDKATPATENDVTEVAKEMLEAEADEMGARTKGETTLGDISVVKELDKSSPRDAASGLPTGKRQHKPVSVTAPIDKSTPILMKTRDAASGLPTGKREHSKLDPDSDDDSVTDEACDTVDNDCDTDTSDDSGNSKRAAYMKLGDIKGEAMDAAEGNSDSSSSKAFMKFEGVVGESQDKAVGESSGAIAGIAIGVVASPDVSDTDTSTAHKKGYDFYQSANAGAKEACAEIREKGTEEQLKTCIDGHVTVLK